MTRLHPGSLFVTLAVCTAPSLGQQPAFQEQTAEVLKSWVRASVAVSRVRIRATDTYERWKEDRFVAHLVGRNELLTSAAGSASRGQATVIEQGNATTEETRADLRNRDYEARIMSPDGIRWRLDQVGTVGLAGNGPPTVQRFENAVDDLLPWLRQNGYLSFYRVLNDPRCKTTRVEPLPGGGRRFHCVMESAAPPPPNEILTAPIISAHANIRGGWFDVSGSSSRIDAFDIESVNIGHPLKKTYHEIGSFEYVGDATLPAPFAKRVVVESPAYEKRNGTIIRFRVVREFEFEFPTVVDEREFYLSHYGLPEPPGITPPSRPTPTYVWLLLAAGGFGVVTLGCRWLLKRRAKVALPPPVPPTA